MITLKELRDKSGLTLRQVEEATGLSNAYMSQLESGKIKKPSAQVLYTLAKFYSYDLNKLLIEAQLVQDTDIVPAVMRTSVQERLDDFERRLLALESKDYRDPMEIPIT